MLSISLIFAMACISAAFCWKISRAMATRVEALRADLGRVSEVLDQMADMQMKTHQKLSARFEGMEEQLMELSIPSQDSGMPLERRHQVLALARQGIPVEEIGRRLKAPVGEAELILNLRKFMGGEAAAAARTRGQVAQHG